MMFTHSVLMNKRWYDMSNISHTIAIGPFYVVFGESQHVWAMYLFGLLEDVERGVGDNISTMMMNRC